MVTGVQKFFQISFEVKYLIFSICKKAKKVFRLEHEADISEMPVDCFLIFARGKTTNVSLLLSAFLNFPCHHFEIVGVIPHTTATPKPLWYQNWQLHSRSCENCFLSVGLKAEHRHLKIGQKSKDSKKNSECLEKTPEPNLWEEPTNILVQMHWASKGLKIERNLENIT